MILLSTRGGLGLLLLLLAALALSEGQQSSRRGGGRRTPATRRSPSRGSSSRTRTRARARSSNSEVRTYCRRYEQRLKRAGKSYTEEKCHRQLEKFCLQRCRKGRSLTSKCEKGLEELKPDWQSSCTRDEESWETEDDDEEEMTTTTPAPVTETSPRGPQQTAEQALTDRWSSNRNLKKTWREVRVKKASPAKLKEFKNLGARIVQRDAQSADRMFGASAEPLKERDPRRTLPVSEMRINNADDYVGGDMDMTAQQMDAEVSDTLERLEQARGGKKRRKRKVAKAGIYAHWPAGQPISYHFADSFPAATRTKVKDAIKLWEENTCIRFLENGPSTNRLEFANGAGCSSYVGMVGGTQEVSIRTPGCDVIGIITHEIGHALGFFHEQARPDRDGSVEIVLNNVNFWYQNNFAKMDEKDVDPAAERIQYDYGSVMHYDPYSFAVNDKVPSIRPRPGKESFQETMGQRKQPSFVDFNQVNAVYCATSCRAASACENGGYQDPNDCNMCKCPSGFGGRLCDIPEASRNCPEAGELVAYSAAHKQTLETPNYAPRTGGRFPRDSECVWLLTTEPGHKIFYEMVEDFDLDCKAVCDENYMEIKATADFRPTGPRFCCDYVPFSEVRQSETHRMAVMLRNLNRGSFGGFKIRYWSSANTAPRGGGVQTPRPTTTTTTRRPTLTTTQDTSAGAGGGPSNCECGPWGAWSPCGYACGGCGRITRNRDCGAHDHKVKEKCFHEEKRICNREKCSDTGFKFTPGGLMMRGCCGSLQRDGMCGPLNFIELIGQFVGGDRGGSSGGNPLDAIFGSSSAGGGFGDIFNIGNLFKGR